MNKLIRRLGSFYLHKTSTYYFLSFPKSGRTWIKSFLANYYSNYLRIPLFYNFCPIVRLGKRKNIPGIIFMHPSHRDVSNEEQAKFTAKLVNKKIILLIRDPERVVFTYYHRLLKRMRDTEVATMNMQQFIRDPSLGISQIVSFMNYWYEARGTFKDFILVRYEDCVNDPEKEFERILNYLETPVVKKELELALVQSVDTTRKIEQNKFIDDGSLQSDISKGSQYFESNYNQNGSDELCERYNGNEVEYKNIFTEEDISYMKTKLSKLPPEMRYC